MGAALHLSQMKYILNTSIGKMIRCSCTCIQQAGTILSLYHPSGNRLYCTCIILVVSNSIRYYTIAGICESTLRKYCSFKYDGITGQHFAENSKTYHSLHGSARILRTLQSDLSAFGNWLKLMQLNVPPEKFRVLQTSSQHKSFLRLEWHVIAKMSLAIAVPKSNLNSSRAYSCVC